jgi:hypothetical protein
MNLNIGMTIWILAILLMASVSLAGWRMGAIRAAFAFVGIIFATLLAVPLGHLFRPLLPHLGASNPIMAWALAPIFGFIVASIPLKIVGFKVYQRVEHFYKYQAGDLRLALWERLHSRLGICIGLMNGAAYFVLISFFIFTAAYWTTQTTAPGATPGIFVRLINALGNDLQSTGFSKTASAVGSVSPMYYKLADLSGLLMQNPKIGPRFGTYPGLTSLWQREDMQLLVGDAILTNAPAAGASLSDILGDPNVQAFLANKDQIKTVLGAVTNQLDDLNAYLQTGKSAKYEAEKILGVWQCNPMVSLAWLRQDQPKMAGNEMRAYRALWPQAYAQTTFLMTGDGQLFVKNWPKFGGQTQASEPPFQSESGKGDWSHDGANYTLHITVGSGEKFLTASTDGVRLTVKDGRNQLIFDHTP